MLRIKNRWHKNAKNRSLPDIAQTLGFNCWRIAANAVVELEKEFKTETYTDRLNIIGEYLAFLLQATDRLTYAQFSEEERHIFISALANDVAERFADNQRDLLGEGEHKKAFIDLLNQQAIEYGDIEFLGQEGGFAFCNYFGQRMQRAMHDQPWVVEYMVDIAAPEAIKQLRLNIKGLLSFQADKAEDEERQKN
ncbi:hypothetical protein [Thioflexithrix psekupsensis]|uniref:Uncharacterized protein n=1 Tax=Thioflexithrix psekupsensis TaxID=1570016 RepID=A0A251X4G8_9GAMM|nr:hypothetical protein [Thioflexithrix psekupsensis]OUD12403.1 hypothetical protein TPSD3_14945 [Thioflexithrix psekupsensis]